MYATRATVNILRRSLDILLRTLLKICVFIIGLCFKNQYSFVLMSLFAVLNRNMEKLWLGPWKYLLLGHQSADQHSEAVLENLITGLESEFKLEANPALIKVILGGVASVDELKECVSQLVSYKAYFGRGGCCGRDRLRAFSCQIDAEALVSLEHLCNGVVNELAEPVERTPVILVLDTDVQVSIMISLLLVISSVIKKVFLTLL